MTNETDNTSVVIIDLDNDQQLEPMLRRSLEQADEATKREVIVVAGKGRKESEALLERLRPQYPDLRITFVPDSSRRMNRRKIALTLGVKAATHNQIVIFDTLTQHFTPYMQFAQSVMHKKLARRTGGIDFATGLPRPPPSVMFAEIRFRCVVAPTTQIAWADVVRMDASHFGGTPQVFSSTSAEAAAGAITDAIWGRLAPDDFAKAQKIRAEAAAEAAKQPPPAQPAAPVAQPVQLGF